MTASKTEFLEAAREIKASNARDRKDRDIIEERLISLAVKALDVEPEVVTINFRGAGLNDPIIYIMDQGVETPYELSPGTA